MASEKFNIVKLEATERNLCLLFIEDVRQAVIKSQTAKGITASGASAEGLLEAYNDNTKTATLTDTLGYFRFQEYGRKPTGAGTSTGPMTLQQAIYDWLEFRKYGFNYANDKERTSLSWAISKTIHAKGTLTARLGRPTGVLTEVINDDIVKPLAEALNREYVIAVQSAVINDLKALQTK